MYSIIDIESNGGKYRQEYIIEIAIYQFDGHQIVDQFISLIHPEGNKITPFVQKLTKITPKMVKTAPKFHEVAKRIVEITEGTTLVGHNVDFDYRMLRQSFKRLGFDFKIQTIDTIPLAQKLLPNQESYSLGKLVKALGIPLSDRHRASGDARATVDLFKLLLDKDQKQEIIQEQFERADARNYHFKVQELTENLPSEKGIIYFQNEKGKILFFTYTDDVFQLAKKVFNSKAKRWKKVQEDCEQIHYEEVGNALIAQLITQTKGLTQKSSFFYGLYFRNGKYLIEKNALRKDERPLLKFRSFTQGLKVLNYLQNQSEFKDLSYLENLISLKNKPMVWTLQGRKLGDKCFLVVEKGRITSYGFYEVFSQINTLEKIRQRKIDLPKFTKSIENELKLTLLRKEISFMKV
ncbi:MAG: DNA polymerase III subunit epsilon [Flavobacteriales bacterium]|nr:MAG: DNA polymerase III subunit epsilon [Flavobacteriales bacterium]